MKVSAKLKLPIYQITSIGNQVMYLGSSKANIGYLRRVGEHIKSQGFEVELAKCTDVGPNEIRCFGAERLVWPVIAMNRTLSRYTGKNRGSCRQTCNVPPQTPLRSLPFGSKIEATFSPASLGGTGPIMPLTTDQKRNADIAEVSGYLPAFRSIVQEMCTGFWWHGNDANGSCRILSNGTVCFLKIGSDVIAVTAAHVLKAYISAKHQDPTITCQLGSITYSPENHVIAIDHELDLATFSVSSVVVAGSASSPLLPVSWPPEPIKEGDILLCGGYPGALRQEHQATADFPFQWFLASANPGSTSTALILNLDSCHVPLSSEPLANFEIGGMSGGPVFRYIPPSPIERIELVGFIYEFQESYGLLLARPALHVDASGELRSCAT